MDGQHEQLERLCDEHLAAAETCRTSEARIAHLEMAFRFAQEAVRIQGPERLRDQAVMDFARGAQHAA